MAKGNKLRRVNAEGINGTVLSGCVDALEDLIKKNDVLSVTGGRLFGGGGKKSLVAKRYDPKYNRLEVVFRSGIAKQEIWVGTSPEDVDAVKKYIAGLSKRYFK